MLSNVQIMQDDSGAKWAIAIGYGPEGEVLTAHETHPNFKRIVAQWANDDADGFALLFDVPEAITQGFSKLSERVAVKDGKVFLDGDEAGGLIADTILDHMNAGEDFTPLVNFFEALVTNPLGNVREGLFKWIVGQKAEGNFTITPEGDILGYKSVKAQTAEWRGDVGDDLVYVPSRRGEGIVNGHEVRRNQFIEQVPGDVVEMPRSKVLNAPSQDCGDGLHIGTWSYAKTFYGGGTVMLVKFSPRDIVSLPDGNSSWKLRVCRYTVIGEVLAPLDAPVYATEDATDGLDLEFSESAASKSLDNEVEAAEAEDRYYGRTAPSQRTQNAHAARNHGKGGATSLAAKGRGKNPAQDADGRFTSGRPGSRRDGSGRFA